MAHAIACLTGLTALQLEGGQFFDNHSIAALAALPTLEDLSIRALNVSPAGLCYLAKFSQSTSLTRLSLQLVKVRISMPPFSAATYAKPDSKVGNLLMHPLPLDLIDPG